MRKIEQKGLNLEEVYTIVEQSNILIWRSNTEALYDYFNTAWLKFTGRSIEQEVGNGWTENIHPDDYARCLDTYMKNFNARTSFEMEYRLKGHDGEYRYIFDKGIPYTDAEGSFKGYIGSCFDITNRKQTEAKLRKEQERLVGILRGTNSGTWEWNVQTGATAFNERWAEIIGYTLEELAPINIDTWMKYCHPDDLKVSGELLNKHFEGEVDYYEFEARMKHKNGEWVWVLDRGRVVSWTDDGKPLLMMGTHQDITERKRAEGKLRKSEASLIKSKETAERITAELGESQKVARLGSWYLDIATNEVVWSEELYKMYGFDSSLPPPPYTEHMKLFTEESWNTLSTELSKTRETGIPYELVLEMARDGEHNGWMWVKGEAVFDYNQNIVGLRGVAQDVTQQKQMEWQLKIAKDLAERNEERYRGLLTSVEVGIVVHRLDTTIVSCNKRAVDLLGLTEDQMSGKEAVDPYWNFIYENGAPVPVEDYPIHRVIRNNTAQRNQVLGVLVPNQQSAWLLVNGFPIRNKKGEINEIVTSFVDITDRKLAEEKLILAKEKAEEIAEELKESQKIASLGNWSFNLITGEVIWSEELYKMYGFDPTEPAPSYSDLARLYTTESWGLLSRAVERARTAGESYELELELIRVDGSHGWMWVRGEVVMDRYGHIIGLHGVAQDVTQRKQMGVQLRNAEELAEKSEGRYRGLLTSVEVGILVHKGDTTIVSCNKRAVDLLGLPKEQMIGKDVNDSYWNFIYENGSPIPIDDYPVMRVLKNKAAERNQVLGVVEQGGKSRWLLVNSFPIQDKNGNITEMVTSFIDITERKLAEEKLMLAKESAERIAKELKESQKIARLGSWYLNLATNEVIWSEELYNMYGLDPNQPAPNYTDFGGLYTAESWTLLSKTVQNCVMTGEPYELELVTKRVDGSNGWMWARGEASFDKYRNMIGLRGVAQDITERKLIELQLAVAKEKADYISKRFRTMFNQAPLGMILVDSYTGIIRELNPKFAEIAGRTEEDIQNRMDWISITHPEDIQEDWNKMQLLNEGEIDGFNLQKRYIKPNGEKVWVNVTIASVGEIGNEGKQHLRMIEDITNKKQSEEALLKEKERVEVSENRLLIASQAGQLGIWDWDIQKDCLVWDDRMYQLFGQNSKKTKTNYELWESRLHPEDQARANKEVEDALNGIKDFDTVFRIIHPDGKQFYIRGHAFVLRDKNGKPLRMIGINQDITDTKTRELLLKAQNRQLIDFSNIVAHNLRAPLVNIEMLVNLLENGEDIEEQQLFISKLKSVVSHLNEVFNELIESVQIRQDTEIKSETIILQERLDKILGSLQGQINACQADIRIDFDAAPNILYPTKYIDSIFSNLVSNALKYRSPDKQPVIKIKTEKINGLVVLSVTDNGLGIDMSLAKDKIFKIRKVFHNHPEAKGFGLFMIKTQIEAMGGTIWVESAVGTGSTFFVKFKSHKV